jgi:hypothetical protein
MRKLLCIIFIVSYAVVKAQPGKEAWHWKFGNYCALDFNTGTAVSGVTTFYSSEGCAAISNHNTGQYIMYTNGVYVADSVNHSMFNGINLFGSQYSSQSSLIVPKPGSSIIYYVITVDASDHVPNKGVHYSVVDITYNNGQGKVISQNQALTAATAAEKVTAVKHCNGTDYWIITHRYLSDAFNAYLLSSAGINTTPIISHVGTFIQDTLDNPYYWEAGYLKASPNGKKLALAEADTLAYLELFDFDNSTGVVSNSLKLNNTKGGIYGVSFSPDNTKLYAASCNLGSIFQYDLSSNVASTIIASQYIIIDSLISTRIGYEVDGAFGALQMAPDGKIYIARYNIDTLAVINNPNNVGASCNFKLSGFPLAPGTKSQFGLPNFIDANYIEGINLNIPYIQPCATVDTLNVGLGFKSYQWSTGDTNNSIVVNTPGKYWVTVINQQGCMAYDTLVASPKASLPTFIMPNIVTPNGDNINDEIDFSKYQFSSLQLEIYNRWGLKIFESTDPTCVWKPSSNDSDGTYFTNLQYRIDCGADSQTKKINNFIILVR